MSFRRVGISKPHKCSHWFLYYDYPQGIHQLNPRDTITRDTCLLTQCRLGADGGRLCDEIVRRRWTTPWPLPERGFFINFIHKRIRKWHWKRENNVDTSSKMASTRKKYGVKRLTEKEPRACNIDSYGGIGDEYQSIEIRLRREVRRDPIEKPSAECNEYILQHLVWWWTTFTTTW